MGPGESGATEARDEAPSATFADETYGSPKYTSD